MKVVRLSALCTGRLYPIQNIPGAHFCSRLSRPQGPSAVGRIMSMKDSNDNIGNRIHDLSVCSAVPQPSAPPVACPRSLEHILYFVVFLRTIWLSQIIYQGCKKVVRASDRCGSRKLPVKTIFVYLTLILLMWRIW
jgi:hypothetical protein